MRHALSLLVLLTLVFAAGGEACAAKYKTWREITDVMTGILEESCATYTGSGDAAKAKELVNQAYFDFYEALGVERAVKNYVSGRRASAVEYQFAEVKRLMTDGAPEAKVRASFDLLNAMLREDADALDGRKDEGGFAVFVASLFILLREGLEAMLVVAAIAAYLVRSGNAALNRVVYANAAVAVVLSAVLAWALQKVFSIGGANQEILEGVTMLIAVVVLFCVSNWMVSKAEGRAWKSYIEGKVSSAVTRGSAFALGAAAFLAVFREGAETILFYQALMSDARDHMDMVWYGIAAASACLAVLFVIIRYGSLKLPLRPFFIGTSILMYIMSIAFAGGGVKELQEADMVSVTPVPGMFSIDLLGVYPTVETLAPQVVLLVVAVFSFCYYRRKSAAIPAAQ